jgi:hypothetical protein
VLTVAFHRNSFNAELVKKQQKQPLKPEMFLTLSRNGSQSMCGLRDAFTAENYLWFCEHFMECVIPSTDWKLKSRNKKLSHCVTPFLEAFAVLACCNSFEVWDQRWTVDPVNDGGTMASASDESDDLSAITGLSPKKGFRFTAGSKGSKKHEGWDRKGMDCYNDLLGLVEKQRARAGCTFEHDLLVALSKKRKTGRGNSAESQPTRVRNGMSDLMRLVGV